jgi:hypothetical protein
MLIYILFFLLLLIAVFLRRGITILFSKVKTTLVIFLYSLTRSCSSYLNKAIALDKGLFLKKLNLSRFKYNSNSPKPYFFITSSLKSGITLNFFKKLKKKLSLKNIITIVIVALVLYFLKISLLLLGLNPYTFLAFIFYGFLAKFLRELISEIFDIYSLKKKEKLRIDKMEQSNPSDIANANTNTGNNNTGDNNNTNTGNNNTGDNNNTFQPTRPRQIGKKNFFNNIFRQK